MHKRQFAKKFSKPKLDIDRLKEIRAALDTLLVLHGGSGLSDDDFKNDISGGIAKEVKKFILTTKAPNPSEYRCTPSESGLFCTAFSYLSL